MGRDSVLICRFGKWEPRARQAARKRPPRVKDPFIEPGALVRLAGRPDWGLGQVQTVVEHKVTVNFEDAGKQVIDTHAVRLTYVGPDPRE